jgi:hypothetical protein
MRYFVKNNKIKRSLDQINKIKYKFWSLYRLWSEYCVSNDYLCDGAGGVEALMAVDIVSLAVYIFSLLF